MKEGLKHEQGVVSNTSEPVHNGKSCLNVTRYLNFKPKSLIAKSLIKGS
jgi:hypothetical protein